jgi:hypothetical protein
MGRTNNMVRAWWAYVLVAGLCACDTSGDFDAPDTDYFIKYYGGSGNQLGVDMVVESDGTVVAVGRTELNASKRIYFVRIDSKGQVLNERIFGSHSEDVRDIEPSGDGNYIVLSLFTNNNGGENLDVKLTKITPEGAVLDSGIYVTEYPYNDDGKSVTPVAGGGYVVAGRAENLTEKANPSSSNPDLGDFFLYKFDAALDTVGGSNVWISRAGSPSTDGAVKYFELDNGTGVCFGYSKMVGANNARGNQLLAYTETDQLGLGGPFLVFNPAGVVNNSSTTITSVTKTPSFNPGYFITGVSINSLGLSQLFICKLKGTVTYGDEDVELYNTLSPTGAGQLTGISATTSAVSPQGFLIGANDVQQLGTSNIWLTKIDLSGKELWSVSFGSDQGDDEVGAVAELPDGKILVLGTVELGDNKKKLTLIKLNSKGQLRK